ncbi:MAG TPA: peptidase domain-containing ABC transporter [Rhodanobacteraceae bacterium]
MNSSFVQNLQFGWHRHLPTIMQTEAAECGLACLAMIARYHGHEVDLPSLRGRFPTSLKGANLADLMDMAARLGMQPRALRLELAELPQLKTPCIVHWDLNHFVVLKSASKRRVVIHDPARGVCVLATDEASRHFTGIALELAPGTDFKPIKQKRGISLRALAGHVQGLGGALTLILVLAVGLEIFALAGPFYLQWILDHVLISNDHDLMTLLGIGFVLVTLFQATVSAVRAWTVTWLSASLSVQWVGNLFTHLLHLPLDWYQKRHIGDVVSRFGSVQAIQKTLTTSFVTAIIDGLMTVFTLVILCLYSVKLTLLVLGAFALYGALRWATFRPLRRTQEDQIIYAARQQSQLLEAIRGAQTLKLHNQQTPRSARYANAIVETTNRHIAMQRLNITFHTGNQLIFGLERVVLIWLAAVMVMHGQFTAGMLVAFAAYAEQFTTRAGGLIDKGIALWMLGLHAERVADIALTPPEAHLETGYGGPLPDACIELRHVGFRYGANEPWILKDCNLRIGVGESVAITGPSGCGKTTLVRVLLGLLEPQEGDVLCGGLDIRQLGLARYRDIVGAVLQDDRLFAGTIADNISFFAPDALAQEVEKVARIAAIHDDIVAMPMGYQTLVGDMGSSLSGGQQQRLLLARALYRRPRLLVLDEATSNLDVAREHKVNAVVDSLAITRIVIAHRPETIASAQRVMTMENGTVRQVSSHLDLGSNVVYGLR